ncbi:MAG: hypothetical protein IAF38_14405, partial [Bacteroidia bacterium]|nr:hypothetical protein [Bacteroidia bacterium]
KFFNSISFIDTKKISWKKFTPPNGGFSAELPANVIYEKPENKKVMGAAEKLQAYDPATEDFYFAMRAYYNDFQYIEEDTFELNMFLNKFLEKKNFEVTEKKPGMFGKYPMLSAKLKDKTSGEFTFLNFYLKGPHYFLLGAKTKNNSYPTKFFNSFKFEDFKFTGNFKDTYDSTMYFTVNDEFSDKEDNLINSLMRRQNLNYYQKKEKKKFDNSYMASYLEKNVYSPSSNENIRIEFRKFNDYRMSQDKDKFWKNEIEYITQNYGLIVKEKKFTESKGAEQYDLLFTDTASTRGIRTRMILKNGVEYVIQGTVDTLSQMSFWMDNYFKSFKPKDSIIGKSPFEDKVKLYLDDLTSKDSSKRNAACNSSQEPEFKKEHLDQLLKFMETPAFRTYSLDLRAKMIWNLGSIKDDKVISYLQKQYPIYSDTASLQFSILSALAGQQKELATKTFLDLLKTETPLTNNNSDIYDMFGPFYDSLEFARSLFPGLLELTKFAEYKPAIYDLLSALVEKDLLKGPAYANQKGILQNEAIYELKRFKANEVANAANGSSDYNYDYNSGGRKEDIEKELKKMLGNIGKASNSTTDYDETYDGGSNVRTALENYAVLLVPFYAEPLTKKFFEKLLNTKNEDLLMQVNLILLKNKIPTNDTLWNFYAKNEKTRLDIYKKLEDMKRLDKFPAQYKTQENFIRSLLYGFEEYKNPYSYGDNEDEEEHVKDSIVFITKKLIKNKTNEGYVYFFKRKTGKKEEWRLDYSGFQPKDEKKISTRSRYQKTGLVLYEDKTIEEQIDEIVAELQMKGRIRVDGGSTYDYGGDYNYGDY